LELTTKTEVKQVPKQLLDENFNNSSKSGSENVASIRKKRYSAGHSKKAYERGKINNFEEGLISG
jgi:hypothetical protein